MIEIRLQVPEKSTISEATENLRQVVLSLCDTFDWVFTTHFVCELLPRAINVDGDKWLTFTIDYGYAYPANQIQSYIENWLIKYPIYYNAKFIGFPV